MTDDTKGTNRRGFLKLAGTAAPAAIAAAALSKPDAAQAKPVDLSSTTIQDTDHTRTYLASARF